MAKPEPRGRVAFDCQKFKSEYLNKACTVEELANLAGLEERTIRRHLSAKQVLSAKQAKVNVGTCNRLEDALELERGSLRLGPPPPPDSADSLERRVVCLGDVNFDFTYNHPRGSMFPAGPPGRHLQGDIGRAVGGTAVNFARAARAAGFQRCTIVGSVGDDILGGVIEKELKSNNFDCLLGHVGETSIAIVLRERQRKKADTALTITHSYQELRRDIVNQTKTHLRGGNVLFVSGYCLADERRRNPTIELIDYATGKETFVVLDVTVDFDKAMDYDRFTALFHGKIQVLVAEAATLLKWWGLDSKLEQNREFARDEIVPRLLRGLSPTAIYLRHSMYTYEVKWERGVCKTRPLDYQQRPLAEILGYVDTITANNLWNFFLEE